MVRTLVVSFLMLAIGASNAYAQDPTSLAVMPLVPQRIPAEITAVLDELLVTDVHSRSGHKVIGTSDINALLGFEKMKSAMGCDDVSCAAEIGGALGVDLMLSGTVARLGEELIITLKLIDITKTEIQERVSLRIPNDETNYVAGISSAVSKVFGLEVAPPVPEKSVPVAEEASPKEMTATTAPEDEPAVEETDSAGSDRDSLLNAISVAGSYHVIGFGEDLQLGDGPESNTNVQFSDILRGLTLEYRREYAGFLATRFRFTVGSRTVVSSNPNVFIQESSTDSFEREVGGTGVAIGLFEEATWTVWEGKERWIGVDPSFDLYLLLGAEVMPPHPNFDTDLVAGIGGGGGLRFYWLSIDALVLQPVAPGDRPFPYRTEQGEPVDGELPPTFPASLDPIIVVQAALSFNF